MASPTLERVATDVPPRMRALVLTGPEAFHLDEVPTPQPGPREVLCRVEAVGICGTDPHIIEGRFPGRWPKRYPFIPGHEWSGTVVALGEGAELFGWQVGDWVAGTSHAGCGYCRMCTTGRYNLCDNYGREEVHRQYGHYSQGAYAQYVVHSIKSVFKIPPTMSLDEAALVDPASIALHSVKRGEPNPGDTVAVLGPGAVGLLTAQCADAVGAGRVLVVGHGPRLAKVRELGFEAIDYDAGDPVEAVRAATGGRGVDMAIDTAGTALAIRQAIDMTRKGGRVVFTGVPLEPVEMPMQKIVLEEIDLYGVRANRNTCDEVIALMARGKVRAQPIITHRFPLTRFAEAYDTFVHRKGGALKVLVKPNEE
jgi:L-iditol 2-dehydrogenase